LFLILNRLGNTPNIPPNCLPTNFTIFPLHYCHVFSSKNPQSFQKTLIRQTVEWGERKTGEWWGFIFSSAKSTSVSIKNGTGLLNFPKTRTNLLHPQQNENEFAPSPSGMLYFYIFGESYKFLFLFFAWFNIRISYFQLLGNAC